MNKKSRPRGRPTTKDENTLWQRMTEDVQPLVKDESDMLTDNKGDKSEAHSKPPPVNDFKPRKSQSATARATQPAPPSNSSQTTSDNPPQLDGRTAHKLRKGKIPIEATLDLHGLNQPDAHAALNRFIQDAAAAQKRCVLVITGKGSRRAHEDAEKGVLRRRLTEWIAMPPLASLVLQALPAKRQHGGDGAFYIYLKRRREA